MAIDHKPVNGCKIQNSCGAISQVMMQLKLVKSEADEDRYMAEIRSDAAQQRRSVYLLPVTNLLIDLVNPWKNTWPIVCSDSYFSSVPAFGELGKIGLHLLVWLRRIQNNIICTS